MILLLLLFSFFNPATSSELCVESHCSNDRQTIRFPFTIENRQPKPCGYPGFDLSCQGTGPPLLHLPPSGYFRVKNIDYKNQEIRINDPEECLPRKILSLDLSRSPFIEKNTQNVTFFNCSTYYYPPYLHSTIDPIYCLSDSSYTVFAASSPMFVESLHLNCSMIKTVSVPFSSDYSSNIYLWNDLLLRWKNPDCGRCESLGRRCELKPNSSHEVQCTNISQGSYRGGTNANAVAIVMGGIASGFVLLGLLCCLCIKVNFQLGANSSRILAHWIQPTNNMGLDGPTIDSYPKFELDESISLPKPNDNICPICLAHYRPKEIVKTIPNCQHCFHQSCIDQWLRLNASCPFCRKSHVQSPPSDPS